MREEVVSTSEGELTLSVGDDAVSRQKPRQLEALLMWGYDAAGATDLRHIKKQSMNGAFLDRRSI